MNCVLYARVSTQEQAELDLSIPAQIQAMREYAQKHDWCVVGEFVEPGASARTADRPALQQMLARLTEGNVDVVLVHKVDRLARNVADHVAIRALLKQRSVRLASVAENVDDSVSGQLVENIMASIAQFYSANLSEEVKKGMRQKVLQGGWPHRPPRGYVIIRTSTNPAGTIEVHPKDGPLMRRAFELYATGCYSVQALANRLAAEGLLASSGVPVAHAHISRLLANPFYVGRVSWKGTNYPANHPPLVSQDVFDKVQRVMRERYRNPGPRGSVIPGFPLRGLAICGGCRGRMTCERHGRWRYYRCSRQTFRRDLCPARMCNADRAHEDLKRVCRQTAIEPELADQIAKAAKEVIAKRFEEAATRQQNREQEEAALAEREMRLTDAFVGGDLEPAVYAAKVEELRARRQELAHGRGGTSPNPHVLVDAVDRVLQLATSLWDLYEPLNEARRTSLLKAVFTTLVLDHVGVTGFTLKPPFDVVVKARTEGFSSELVGAVVDSVQ